MLGFRVLWKSSKYSQWLSHLSSPKITNSEGHSAGLCTIHFLLALMQRITLRHGLWKQLLTLLFRDLKAAFIESTISLLGPAGVWQSLAHLSSPLMSWPLSQILLSSVYRPADSWKPNPGLPWSTLIQCRLPPRNFRYQPTTMTGGTSAGKKYKRGSTWISRTSQCRIWKIEHFLRWQF